MPTPLPPVDPDVKLPPAIAAQGARADAIHKQAYQTPDPAPQPQPDPAPQPAPAPAPVPPAPQPVPPPAQPQPPQPPQPVQPPAPEPGDENVTAEQWRHRFLSMQGRYNQAAQTVGSMQEQMSELGDELMRTQALVRREPQPQQPQPQPQALVTDEEIKTYGPELIDVIQRAARAAVNPDLQNLHNGVTQVSQRVQQVSAGGLYAVLDQQVPEWRSINVSPRFKAWCGLRDVYSGVVRGSLLNGAFKAADAPRVVQFFKGFLAEEQATGQLPDPSYQPPAPPVPRVAAIPLESLTAPGRAHPAGGNDAQLPVEKPIFTRNQIAEFYRHVREGRYAGRDADKNATEQAIFAAQREGRVR
jgi:hypothetical protein